jgi:beta-N-acetylhexosaminidase
MLGHGHYGGGAFFLLPCPAVRFQLRTLVEELRGSIGRPNAPVMIDQEGGRVARLRPPHWLPHPAPGHIGALYERAPRDAIEALRLHVSLISAELRAAGISVNCIPMADVRADDADKVIGDRAFSDDPEVVATLARISAETSLAGGVIPVLKHLPGHGRSRVDSHLSLPVVEADADTLYRVDALPFRRLADLPWGMTAHIVYPALDRRAPATLSRHILVDYVRGKLGFSGLLVSDDLCMGAIGGEPAHKAHAALMAGCDIALHCNGKLDEMREFLAGVDLMTDAAWARAQRAEGLRIALSSGNSAPTAQQLASLAERRQHLLAVAA